jgi:hypothetical protein
MSDIGTFETCGRPVLRKPFKYEELVAILTRLKLVPVE